MSGYETGGARRGHPRSGPLPVGAVRTALLNARHRAESSRLGHSQPHTPSSAPKVTPTTAFPKRWPISALVQRRPQLEYLYCFGISRCCMRPTRPVSDLYAALEYAAGIRFASTTRSRLAPPSTRNWWSSTTRSPLTAASILPCGAGTPTTTALTIRTASIQPGKPYLPFHDVQMLVDGEAARALGESVRTRWDSARLARSCSPPRRAMEIPGPTIPRPGFHRCCRRHRAHRANLRRSRGRCGKSSRLFLDSIDAAERSIYIENQFLTLVPGIAERLVQADARASRTGSAHRRAGDRMIPGLRRKSCGPAESASSLTRLSDRQATGVS